MPIARFIYKNRWRDGTVLGQSSQEPEFPAKDTQEDTLKLVWRTENDTETAYVSNNLGAAYEIDFGAILNHNIPVTATIKFIGADDAGFAVNVVTETVDHYSGSIFWFFSSAYTKQYWKLQIEDPNCADNYIKVGCVVLGKYFEPSCNFNWGYSEGREDPSALLYADDAVLFGQEKPDMVVGEYGFESLSDDDRSEVDALLAECGVHKAFVLCFDYTSPNSQSIWIKLINMTRPRNIGVDVWTWAINIVEVK